MHFCRRQSPLPENNSLSTHDPFSDRHVFQEVSSFSRLALVRPSATRVCQRVRSLLLPQSGGEYVASLLSRRSSCRRRDAKRRLPRRERASAAVADAFELCATSRRHDSSARQEHQQQPPHRHPPRACRGRKGARRRCRGTERRSPTLVQSSGPRRSADTHRACGEGTAPRGQQLRVRAARSLVARMYCASVDLVRACAFITQTVSHSQCDS